MHAFVHSPWFGAVVLWIFSAAVGAMPDPDNTSSKGYRWLYGFAHGLSANLDKVKNSIQLPIK